MGHMGKAKIESKTVFFRDIELHNNFEPSNNFKFSNNFESSTMVLENAKKKIKG
jgi:hypothetical protein